MLIVTAIVATGAGLHLAAHYLENDAHVSATAAVLTVAIPVLAFLVLLHALYAYLVQRFTTLDCWLLVVSTGVALIAVLASSAGVNVAACLVLLMLAPAASVVAYELHGYRHHSSLMESERVP